MGTYDPDVAGTVFNIQRFSVHDGPGIRTVVFIKGCSLRCIWCSNPESMSRCEQIGFYPERCIGIDKCKACFDAAPEPAALVIQDGRVTGLESESPRDFLACAAACPTSALKVWGKRTTVGEVMQEVIADRAFYEESGGGLTLSGGEALIQGEFAIELLKAARAEGINTCVETALNYPAEILEAALPYIDLAFCDLKHMDPADHKRFTGVSNKRILSNLRKVVESDIPVVIRIPVVPDHNGTEKNLRATASFIAGELRGRVNQIQLLPFHKLGVEKYRSLGKDYPMAEFDAPPREQWEEDIRGFAAMMSAYGLNAVAGSSNKIALPSP
jgi:pyruvate formate lyase activating enzyme